MTGGAELAQLVVPSLCFDAARGFQYLDDAIAEALELGVGGFLVEGEGRAPKEAVAELVGRLHAESRVPLLVAACAERGAGGEFAGCTELPPLGALAFAATRAGAADPRSPHQPVLGVRRAPLEYRSSLDSGVIRRAARLTARELRALGITWTLAPVCDLDVEHGSPVVGVRSAGAAAAEVADVVTEWIDACQAEGVLACAKHFPGLGRASGDSRVTLPTVRDAADFLRRNDLVPFRAAVDAGVASVMTAHAAYPALGAPRVPAAEDEAVVRRLLRDDLRFDGLVVGDVRDARGAGGAESGNEVAVRAIAAGCDVLLIRSDVAGVVQALEKAVRTRMIPPERVHEALQEREQRARWAAPDAGRETPMDDVLWARQAADRAVFVVRGAMPKLATAVEVVAMNDAALVASAAPARSLFPETLRALDIEVLLVEQPSEHTPVPVLVAACADVVAGEASASFSEPSRRAIAGVVSRAKAQQRECAVILFGHPRLAAQLPAAVPVLCAWAGTAVMQAAAARVLVRG